MTSDVSEPLADPAAVGSAVTLTVHDPLAGIEAPQVLAWLPKVRLDGGDACGGCRKRNRHGRGNSGGCDQLSNADRVPRPDAPQLTSDHRGDAKLTPRRPWPG
jgi:hypothetical protein